MHRNNLAIEKDCTWGAVEKNPTIVTVNAEENVDIEVLA
jgi:hypothetical protein